MENRNGKFFQQTEEYVNKICQAFIMPNGFLKKIECRHKGVDGIGYIKVTDCTDNSHYYDITGLSLERIGIMVASIVAGKPVDMQITEFEHRKYVAELFN